ncbi:MAG: OB-fold domain-containing protein [Candidatus Thorarchaeota archaeon]
MGINASKCMGCDRAIVPPRKTCPYCGMSAGTMIPVQLKNEGTILSHTISRMPPEGFKSPLVLALVQLEQSAVVLCLCDLSDSVSLKIGMEVFVKEDGEGRFLLDHL